ETLTFWARVAVGISSLITLGLLLAVARLLLAETSRQEDDRQAAGEEAERMQQLVAARTAELSALTSHLQSVIEQEKSELARNLHDELGGLLTAAKMDLSWLKNATAHLGPGVSDKLEELDETLSVA